MNSLLSPGYFSSCSSESDNESSSDSDDNFPNKNAADSAGNQIVCPLRKSKSVNLVTKLLNREVSSIDIWAVQFRTDRDQEKKNRKRKCRARMWLCTVFVAQTQTIYILLGRWERIANNLFIYNLFLSSKRDVLLIIFYIKIKWLHLMIYQKDWVFVWKKLCRIAI